MAQLTPLDKIYDEHRIQINSIVSLLDKNYTRASVIIAWLYGGTSEGWRKFLPKQKSDDIPKEVKDFFKGFKKTNP